MFRFFRKNMAIIGWSIVGFFGITMFSGSVFFGFDAIKNRGDQDENVSSSETFVSLGNHDVDIRPFYQQYQATIENYTMSGLTISPIVHEQILIQSLQYAVNQQAFYIAAQEELVETTKEEVNALEQDYLLQLDIKDKSSLKKKLKENKGSYKDFRVQLEKDAMIRKFQSQYPSDIVMDVFLIENTFKQFQVDYIIINNKALSDEQIKEQALTIKQALVSGQSRSELEKTYEGVVSINSYEEPRFQDYLGFDPVIRDQLVKLDIDAYLEPFCEASSCAIVQIKGIQVKEKPADYDEATYSEALKSQLQQKKIQRRIDTVFKDHPMMVYDAVLNSVYLKSQGKFLEALNVYQELLSLNPSDPAPHFFRAEIFVRQGNDDLALQELEKAALKAQMLPQSDFAELHIFYADLLLQDKQREAGFSQYELAFDLSQDSSEFLKLLKERYKKHKFMDNFSKFDKRIAAIELEKKQAKEAGTSLSLEQTLESNQDSKKASD